MDLLGEELISISLFQCHIKREMELIIQYKISFNLHAITSSTVGELQCIMCELLIVIICLGSLTLINASTPYDLHLMLKSAYICI